MNDTLPFAPIRSSWNAERLAQRGYLTDKIIERRIKEGWYSDEFRKARREMMAAAAAAKRRKGNFEEVDGRLIYRPV